ncbi:hypothetical protein AB4254_11420 [Vibrio breoganii]
MSSDTNAEDGSYKIIVIDYFATCEGRHIYIKTGTKSDVRKDVGDWFFQGASIYTVEQWLDLDKYPESREYAQSNIEVLKVFAPILWQAMNTGVHMDVDIEYHWNES